MIKKFLGMHKARVPVLLYGTFLILCQASAAPGDTVQPYVSASVIHDTNLFRLSSSRDPRLVLGSDSKSYTIKRVEAGLSVDYAVGRQQIILKGGVNQNWFERFSFLNYDGSDARATWNWQFGNLWQGDLGYSHGRTLTSFTQLQDRLRAIQTQQSAFGSAVYKLDPDWRIRAGAGWSSFNSGLPQRRFFNRDEAYASVGIMHINEANNSLGVEVKRTEARFPEREVTPLSIFDNGYTQTELSAVADWRYTGQSRFQGRLGYTQSRHKQISTRDFNGVTGRLAYDWSVSGKTLLNMALWREVGAIDNVASTYVATKGASLGVSWFPASKIFVKGEAAYKWHDFTGVVNAGPHRKDDVRSISASLGYTPASNVQLSLDGKVEKRSSNIAFIDYDSNNIAASVKIVF